MQILAFPESIEPARKLANAMKATFGCISIHRFPDGESGVTLPVPLEKIVVFFRGLHDPNAKLVELLLAMDAARSHGCERVILVTPYLCYMRQDKAFQPGQAISQQIIGRLLSSQVDDLITVDPHLHRINHLSDALPHCRSITATASTALGDFLCQQEIRGLLIGPDEESAQWVSQVARHAGLDFVIASKQRFGDRDVKVTLPDMELQGQDIILVDDVISSGKTMIETARMLRQAGAERISALCTHALFAPGALEEMQQSGIYPIWSTDSIAHATNQIELTPTLCDALRELTGETG